MIGSDLEKNHELGREKFAIYLIV